jgi:hypothetical protein
VRRLRVREKGEREAPELQGSKHILEVRVVVSRGVQRFNS